MNNPRKDGRSVDNYAKYSPCLDVHHSSGIYNKAFYNLTENPGWNMRKSFQVFTIANKMYWAANSTMSEGACGVLKATGDYYSVDDVKDVRMAFESVGVICQTDEECIK